MADLDLVWKELISRLKRAKESVPGKATALCPAHNDKNPSLSVKLTDQKILLNCHAGCSFTAIVSALNMYINQFNTKNSKPKKRRQEVCRPVGAVRSLQGLDHATDHAAHVGGIGTEGRERRTEAGGRSARPIG